MDSEFGISIQSLFEVVQSRIQDLTLLGLKSMLRNTNVFFWPMSRMDSDNFCMVPASATIPPVLQTQAEKLSPEKSLKNKEERKMKLESVGNQKIFINKFEILKKITWFLGKNCSFSRFNKIIL